MKKTKLKKLNPVLFSTEQNEQNFEIAFKNAPIGMCLTDSKGNFLKVNKAYCKMLGYSEKELLATGYPAITHPDDVQNNLNNTRKTVAGEMDTFEMEKRYITKKGKTIWIHLRTSLARDKNNNPLYFIAQIQDITKRKEAEQVLRESEEKFRTTFHNAPIGMAINDLDGNLLQVNRQICKMLGYSEKELLEKTLKELTLPEDLQQNLHQRRKMLKNKAKYFQIEKRYLHKSGRIVWGLLSASLVKDDKGNPLFFIGQVEDITKRKHAEAELQFKSMLADSATDSILVHDTKQILYANETAYKSRGYTKNELFSMPLSKLIVPEYAQNISKNLKNLKQKAGGIIFESAHYKKDGSIIHVEVHSKVIDKLNGNPVSVNVVRDITDRKKAKELSDALNKINTAINSILSHDRIMHRVVIDAAKAIGCESSAIILRDKDKWNFKYLYGKQLKLKVKAGEEMTDKEIQCGVLAAETEKIVVCTDAQNDSRFDKKLMKQFNIRSFITVPLIIKDKFIGVLDFYYHSKAKVFGDAQIDFAHKLAISISLALENARLYEQEHKIADKLQDALINVPSKITDIDFGYLYRPATGTAKVGGDFYDLFKLHNHNVGIIVGDVSGKGLEAASVTALVRNTIKAYAYQGDDPALAMTKTNNIVAKATPIGTFVTVIFAILNTKTAQLTYCSAGHPQGIVKAKTSIKMLETSSPAIGVILNERFISNSTFLEAEDLLVLYTDGVIDAKCTFKGKRKDFYGEKRLLNTIKKSNATAKTIPEEIFQSIMYCPGCVFPDDIVILAVSLAKKRNRQVIKAARLAKA